MHYKPAQSVIGGLKRQLKGLVIGVLALLLCNALLALLLWRQSGRHVVTVLVPSTLNKRALLSRGTVSASYLEAMALMLVGDRLNITPDTVAAHDRHVLGFVMPDEAARFKRQLRLDERTVHHDQISSSFYVHHIKTDVVHLTVNVTGTLKRWVGTRALDDATKTYRLSFKAEGDPLLLSGFKDITPDKKAS